MNKKIISFVLCLTLLFGNLLPIASAEEGNILSTDDVFVENTESVTEPAETEAVTQPSGTEAVTEPVVTTVPAETVSETQPEPTETDEEDAPAFGAPACDCGSQSALIIGHSDVCAMKQFYKDLCAGTASDVYALWNEIPKNAQAYIMTYLGYQNPAALKELVFLLASKWESESGLSGVAAAIKDGTLFGAFGIPEDAVLQIKEAAAEAKAAIEAFVAQQKNAGKELFTWDISVLNGEGISWQPDGSVRVELELPGEKLHKYTQVYVVHVDDEGNAEKIEAEVIDGNKIAFYTHGFSTFAGFTVDFEYDGTPFSIPGMSSILLSELMDKLKMPFEVADVADVTFTNYDLISIEKQENDWLLTSLQAFQTNETLSLTIGDKVYDIKVTDAEFLLATRSWHVYNSHYYDGCNHVYDSGYDAKFANDANYSDADWVSSRIATFSNGLNHVITLVPKDEDEHTVLYIDMFQQFEIYGGSNLTIQVDPTYSGICKEVVIQSDRVGYALFYLTNGSLTLKGTANTKIVLDYGSPTNYFPLIYATESATNIFLEHVKFRNSRNSGIGIKANEINTLSLKDCEFESTVNRVKIDGANYAPNPYGGAIHVWDYYGTTSVDVLNLYLERVKFNGNTAGSYGGAIATYGRVFNVDIVDCDFLNCKAQGGNGGAIFTCGIIGTFDVTGGTLFKNCTATQHGGAVNFMSLKNSAGNYSTANDIKFTECEFNNCRSLDSYGGAISVASQTNKVEVLGCTFTDCKAYKDGGAISMYSVALSGKVATGTAAPGLAGSSINNVQYGTLNDFVYAWDQGNNQIVYRTTVDTFIVGDYTNANNVTKHTTFTDCIAHVSGGGICVASGTYIKDADITNAVFNRCRATSNGNALMLVTSVVEDLDITGSTFENCTAIKAKPLKDLYTFDGSWVLFRKGKIDKGTVYYKIGTNRDYVRDSNGDPIPYTAGSNMEVYIRVKRDDTSQDQLSGGENKYYIVGIETATYRKAYQTDSEGFYVQDYSTDNNGTMTYADGYEFIEELEASGTIRTTGATTCILDVTNCIVRRNVSKSNGGGLYWNANTPRGTVERCTVNVTGGEFYGNYAERDGGGIYCESTMTVSGTKIYDNEARCGGGIAQQVYSNSGRMIQEGEVTNLTLSPTAAGVNTEIYNNHARKNGGGVSVLANPTESLKADASGNIIKHKVIFTLNSAIIRDNTAYEHGGGVSYVALTDRDEIFGHYSGTYEELVAEVNSYDKSIQINNAQVFRNQSGISKDKKTVNAGNGGGIYMLSSENTTLELSSGNVYSNTANAGDGGGIYLTGVNALCSITGGTIGGSTANKNHANKVDDVGGSGGGIAISGGASIEMKLATGATTGGVISYNQADVDGGGIYLAAMSKINNVANTITIAEGSIIHNSAGNSGGGISMKYHSEATLNGGEVSNNTAEVNGGGVEVNYYANLTVSGGTIENNTATNGSGGGVFSIWYGSVEIKETSTIKGNKAPKGAGGGVFAQMYNVTISGGEICNNEAKNGAGICVVSAVTSGYKTSISGGSIHDNTASNNGGGLFNQACAYVTISGGDIYKNKAKNGAGVYADSGGTTTISSGDIYSNTASNHGGGGYVIGASLVIEGGSIYSNTAPSSGGGLYVTISGSTGSAVTMSGGDIYSNSTGDGAGWGGGIYMLGASGVNCSFSISGGNIYKNSAPSGCGGGINAEHYSTVEILGGNIYSNTSGSYGGGIQIYNHATATITGGKIYENTGVNGGGIAVTKCSTVSVTDSKDGSTVGMITKNNAVNGGGVFVDDCSDLTVKNAYITYNNAKQMPSDLTTSYQKNEDSLKGTGGGIYVADGTSADASTFTLEGTKVAIYGNLAEFAADDVFANGKYTKLSVPYVSKMDLSGYDRKAEGWFEDYNIIDSQYGRRLGQNSTPLQGTNVRYRGAAASDRFIIPEVWNNTTPNYDAFTANLANSYVCMTLGIPAAVSDTIVIDYGLPVEIDLLVNDILVNKGTLLGIGAVPKQNNQFVEYSENKIGEFGTSVNTSYGSTTLTGSVLSYTPTGMTMGSHEQFAYAIRYKPSTADKNYYYYGLVTIIPATTIYYEDSFLTYNVYQYTKGDTSSANNPNSTATNITGQAGKENYQWSGGVNTDDYTQDVDRVGFNNLDTLDADNLYGTDSHYSNLATYSLGNAKKFTASVAGDTVTYGTAEFTFTGTGFDVISATSNLTGAITVQIYNASDVTGKARPIPSNVAAVKTLLVDTYYGYNYSGGKWTPAGGTTENALYQVPVIKAKMDSYGTYTVVITVSYSPFFDHNANVGASYDFYLDAIRIYDPANDGTGNQVIQDAYVADNEGWPEYLELRNLLLSRRDFDNVESDEPDAKDGIVFIDGRNEISNGTIADYKNYGPNNELYLAPGQSIAFNFTLGTPLNAKVASVQIGLKSVGGSAKVTCYGVAENVGYNISVFDKKTINTATDMYYDITPLLGQNIVITNSGVTGNAILSITNIKVTYKEAHADFIEKTYFPKAKAMATFALRSINQYYADLQAQMSVDLIGATLSFEDEVYTNLYYTTTNLDGAAESDMGLLTWSSMPEDATFENAENVFEGAVYNADNGRYMVRTDGIASKNLGDDIYMRPYVKLSTGSYVYGDLITYSPKQYAMSRLENSSNESLKALCVAMLNYGAAAQTYFGYKTDDLMNADLTAEQQALVSDYSANLFRGAIGANAAKIGEFAKTETGFSAGYASVSFESAFAINYYFTPNAAVDGDVTLYYWTAEDYASAKTLTADNASGALTMVSDDSGNYWAQISGIAAKQLDDTYYVAAVYTSNGETFCTGVIAYSLSAYCMRNANGNMGQLAQATAMYGYYAMNYFG